MTASVTLRPLDPDELAEFVRCGAAGYVEQMVEFGGRTVESAQVKAADEYAALFPGGVPVEGSHVLAAEDDGIRVGHLWLAEQGRDWSPGTAFVYDVEVAASSRGKGYGRAIMLAAEVLARSLGARELALNVFGGNAVAIGLYTSLGYTVTAQQMRKLL